MKELLRRTSMNMVLSSPQITFMFSLFSLEDIINDAIYYLFLSILKASVYDRSRVWYKKSRGHPHTLKLRPLGFFVL